VSRTHGSVVLAGSLAQKPHLGGHTWVFLQYLLGFRRLGWDVLFLDRLEPAMCVDEGGRPCGVEQSINMRYFLDVMNRFGLNDAYSLSYDRGTHVFGLQMPDVIERTRHAAFLLNVMGFLADEDVLASARRRVFLDIDPSVGQMWCELGLADIFRGHDAYVTIGENIGRADCDIPTCGLPWLRFRQPVVLDQWPVTPAPANGRFTSIATWRGTYSPIEYRGRTYGQRVHEFRRFATVPPLTGRSFQLALDIDPSEQRDLAMLRDNAWSLTMPRFVAGTPASYRTFIQRSKAEFMVAKNIVVETNSGWFSDRSSCYLASGRPVLVQDTGLASLYPVGMGLLTFRTLDEAVAGVEEICGNYDKHARAAREIASAYFDSDKVLTPLLETLAAA
jgi:hypothetical protein